MSLIEELRKEARKLRDDALPLRAAKYEAIAQQLEAMQAEIERLREALVAIDNSAFIGSTSDSQEAKQVALESIHDIARASLDSQDHSSGKPA